MLNLQRNAGNETQGQCGAAYPSVAALARELGMCERSTREALKRNEIPHIRLGRRIILPRAAIQEWLRTAGRIPA
jgi:excisionase family DNA binding protein